MDNVERPTLSFIIVTRNAEQYIENLLHDYLLQDYPNNLRELIVVDGASEDATREIAQGFYRKHPELTMTILSNPRRILSTGWNLALRAARGKIVCRVDAHVSIPPDYLRNGCNLLQKHLSDGVVCVGGPWETKGWGFRGRIIAAALSNPFGVGISKFRVSKTAGFVDTVPCGFYFRWVFEQVGYLREDLARNQDVELHSRIHARGWRLFLSPQLTTTYHCRSKVTDFLKQAYGNGYWTMVTFHQSFRRHFIPFLFLGAIVLLGFGGLLWQPLLIILATLGTFYVLLALCFSIKSGMERGEWLIIPFLPLFFFLLHVSYGLGSWWALLNYHFRKSGMA